ncbi:MAG: hypothetical protein H6590_06985 [Flavobacteriales bacterium]|nr:hypothetical protein [Flavobacteriales bacterium]
MSIATRSVICAAVLVVILVGCGERPDGPVVLSTKHWAPGQQVWYRIEVVDSVYGPDEAIERKKVQKGVRFRIIDTTSHGTIEWDEYILMDVNDTISAQNTQEWLPMYRFVYRCSVDGDIEQVVNYSEVKATIDSMVATYNAQLENVDMDLVERITRSIMDSTRVMTSLLSEATLLHRLFNLNLNGIDTLVSLSMQPATEQFHPYYLCRTSEAICNGNSVSIRGWSTSRQFEVSSELTTQVRHYLLDSWNSPEITGHEEMTACFDTLRSLPTYLLSRRVLNMGEHELVQRRLIFLEEEPKP